MENVKKHLSLGVALVIVLCVSTWVSAMELQQPVNPYLSQANKQKLENHINGMEKSLIMWTDPDPQKGIFRKNASEEEISYYISEIKKTLRMSKKIYYGNQPYTDYEIYEAMQAD